MLRLQKALTALVLATAPTWIVTSCGSERPRPAETSQPDALQRAPFPGARGADAATDAQILSCLPDIDIEGTEECECVWDAWGPGGVSINVPCGWTVCVGSQNKTGVCAGRGRLYVFEGYCADTTDRIPRCDGG